MVKTVEDPSVLTKLRVTQNGTVLSYFLAIRMIFLSSRL